MPLKVTMYWLGTSGDPQHSWDRMRMRMSSCGGAYSMQLQFASGNRVNWWTDLNRRNSPESFLEVCKVSLSLVPRCSQPCWNSLNWTEGHTNNTRVTPISQDTNSSSIPRIAILKDCLLHNESKHSSKFAFSNPLVSRWADLARHRNHPTPHPVESCPVAQRVGDLRTVARSLGGPGWRRPHGEGLRNKQTQKTYLLYKMEWEKGILFCLHNGK